METEEVKKYVELNPGNGYKKLAYMMLDQDIVALKSYQVYEVLKEENLLAFGRYPLHNYTKPAKPKRPNQVWHIDIMYLWVFNRWYYLVDVVDGYSRYLVHWTLNTTMHANTVVDTMQEALDTLKPGTVKPHIVHDNGKQFLSHQWAELIEYNGATDIKIRVHHPESNGKVERLHRTHRAECFNSNIESFSDALDLMRLWADEYNNRRPHSALNYMTPYDYHFGDPVKKANDRIIKFDEARLKRRNYWLYLHENSKLTIY
jgi:transposase InsO family protein